MLISNIDRQFKCHFIIIYIETDDIMGTKADTKKNIKEDFDRTVTMLLYKGNYMIYKPVYFTPFYIMNKVMLDKEFYELRQEMK